MTYAIISDIHGNLPAFEAVLADARAYNVDMYLLVGDYTNGFPWGAGVIKRIRGLKILLVRCYHINKKCGCKLQPHFFMQLKLW
ncbi:MAG: metallophosphoesterase [Defluviitaleaceae bacterium]|nr:metallophosphoesterase [Defluviitaleaceae bacterium]